MIFPPWRRKSWIQRSRGSSSARPSTSATCPILCKAFLDRWIVFHKEKLLGNKVGGVLAVGGGRNCGLELTIRSVQVALMSQQMIVVGDAPPTGHWGGTVWGGQSRSRQRSDARRHPRRGGHRHGEEPRPPHRGNRVKVERTKVSVTSMKYQVFTVLCCLLLAASAQRTETENLGIAVLPAPGKVVVDGKCDDWDLSGGVFVCGDVENMRDRFAVWFHAMYDSENLYLSGPLDRRDPAEQSRPDRRIVRVRGRLPAGAGRHGARQAAGIRQPFHLLAAIATARTPSSSRSARTSRAARSRMPRREAQSRPSRRTPTAKATSRRSRCPGNCSPKTAGRRQPGETIAITVEPNFTIGQSGRLTLKDLFKPGVTPDRVFTFMSSNCWGPATLERQGKIQPRPVRLADAREIKVHMEKRRSGGRLVGTGQDRSGWRFQADQVHHARGRLRLVANPQRPRVRSFANS